MPKTSQQWLDQELYKLLGPHMVHKPDGACYLVCRENRRARMIQLAEKKGYTREPK